MLKKRKLKGERILLPAELERLSEYFSNLSVVFFASLVLPVISRVDKVDLFEVLLGGGLAIVFLAISLDLQRRSRLW